ncbi:hypothetical protein ACXWQK_08760, partial [Streptococcus pyogenes]
PFGAEGGEHLTHRIHSSHAGGIHRGQFLGSGSSPPGRAQRQGLTIREAATAPLSGDWRRVGNSLELVAALSVSTPGFPVRREYVAD